MSRRRPSETATERLARLLTLVPWLLNRQGIDLAEAAAEFGVTPEQLEADLSLLFLCGTPGGMPDDLIEAEWEEGKVYLGNADAIARPLRLGLDEALTLVVGLRTLASIPGLGDRDVVDRALAKLEQATGGLSVATTADGAARRIHVDISDQADAQLLTTIRAALDARRRLHLTYYVPARDETTERDVDPMRLRSDLGHWYLEGYCHRSTDVRLFRLDRIREVTVLDEDGTPPPDARPRDLDQGVFRPDEHDTAVRLHLDPQASWVADYYPCESRTDRPDGGVEVVLRAADPSWIRRLTWQSGGAVHILEPESLRVSAVDGALAALTGYRP